MIKIHSLIEWEIGLVDDFTNTNSSNSGCARQGAGGGLSVVCMVVLFLLSGREFSESRVSCWTTQAEVKRELKAIQYVFCTIRKAAFPEHL